MPPPFNNPHTLDELRALTNEYFAQPISTPLPIYKLKPGDNSVIRILPPTEPYFVDYQTFLFRAEPNCFLCDNLDALKYEQFRAKLILEAETEI